MVQLTSEQRVFLVTTYFQTLKFTEGVATTITTIPWDYFLWGYLKQKVYATPPENIDDLIQRITREVNALKTNPNLIKRAVRDMVRRVNVCVEK